MSKVVFKLSYTTGAKINAHINYISTREGVNIEPLNNQIKGDMNSHDGLFDKNGEANKSMYNKMLKGYDGPVYKAIISLRNEDANELGLSNRSAWKQICDDNIKMLAEQIGLDKNHTQYVASQHNKGDHNHFHIVFWDNTINSKIRPTCPKENLNTIRSELEKSIFNQKYQKQEAKHKLLMKKDKKEILGELNKAYKEDFSISNLFRRVMVDKENRKVSKANTKEVKSILNKAAKNTAKEYLKLKDGQIVYSNKGKNMNKAIIKQVLDNQFTLNQKGFYKDRSNEMIGYTNSLGFNPYEMRTLIAQQTGVKYKDFNTYNCAQLITKDDFIKAKQVCNQLGLEDDYLKQMVEQNTRCYENKIEPAYSQLKKIYGRNNVENYKQDMISALNDQSPYYVQTYHEQKTFESIAEIMKCSHMNAKAAYKVLDTYSQQVALNYSESEIRAIYEQINDIIDIEHYESLLESFNMDQSFSTISPESKNAIDQLLNDMYQRINASIGTLGLNKSKLKQKDLEELKALLEEIEEEEDNDMER